MTCVVGLITKSGLIFGADSLVTTELGSKYTLSDKKIFIKNDILFGFCGDLRFGQMVKHSFIPPHIDRERDLELYVHTKLIPELQKVFLDSGHMKIEQGSFDLLVGIGKHIFIISDDFAVIKTASPYQAIGSGAEYALGVMYATDKMANERRRISLALDAASNFSQTVGKPFYFESLEDTFTKKTKPKRNARL